MTTCMTEVIAHAHRSNAAKIAYLDAKAQPRRCPLTDRIHGTHTDSTFQVFFRRTTITFRDPRDDQHPHVIDGGVPTWGVRKEGLFP